MGNSLANALDEHLGEYDIDYDRTITYANGDVYTGDFKYKDQIKEGHVKMIYANGNVYDGQWKNDKRDGSMQIK